VEGRMPAFTQHFRASWLKGDLPFSGGNQRESVVQLSLRDDGVAEAWSAPAQRGLAVFEIGLTLLLIVALGAGVRTRRRA
jgi:hypothetical protein